MPELTLLDDKILRKLSETEQTNYNRSMPDNLSLDLNQARLLNLAALGLLRKPQKPAKPADVQRTIRRLNMLQLDTISVVARAHLHILYSRLGAYDPSWLEDLHASGSLFEYFAHAMCLIPIEDYPLYRALMLDKQHGWKSLHEWSASHPGYLEKMLDHIRENGPVRSSDFKSKQSRGSWWSWKDEKFALELLFYRGDLMVQQRRGFQRVYDLRERVLPDWDDAQTPDFEQAVSQLILNSVRALGIATENWIAENIYIKKNRFTYLIPTLVKTDQLIPLKINSPTPQEAFLHPNNLDLFEKARANLLKPTLTTILSPFDPLLTDRARARTLFNFDYTIECYTPISKRIYGYFTLPILWRGRLIGRMDAKAWRKEKRLQIIKLFFEPNVRMSSALIRDVGKSLRTYADWQTLQEIEINWASNVDFIGAVQSYLNP